MINNLSRNRKAIVIPDSAESISIGNSVKYNVALRDDQIPNTKAVALDGFNDDVTSGDHPMSLNIDPSDFFVNESLNEIDWFLVSTDANDNSTGTGARIAICRMSGLLLEQHEEVLVLLDGTNPVQIIGTQSQYLNCMRILVISSGSVGWNIGDLFVQTSTGATERIVSVGATRNISLAVIYQVPANRSAMLSGASFNHAPSSSAESVLTLHVWASSVQQSLKFTQIPLKGTNTQLDFSHYERGRFHTIWYITATQIGSGTDIVSCLVNILEVPRVE